MTLTLTLTLSEKKMSSSNTNKQLYVVRLSDDQFYVGTSDDAYQRVRHHVSGKGSRLTRYAFLKRVVKISEIPPGEDWARVETKETFEQMCKHGVNKVRGGGMIQFRDYQEGEIDLMVTMIAHDLDMDFRDVRKQLKLPPMDTVKPPPLQTDHAIELHLLGIAQEAEKNIPSSKSIVNHVKSYFPGSRLSVLKQLLQSKETFTWLVGLTGTGKSVILATAAVLMCSDLQTLSLFEVSLGEIKDAVKNESSMMEMVGVVHFFNHDDPDVNSFHDAIYSIVQQLRKSIHAFNAEIIRTFKDSEDELLDDCLQERITGNRATQSGVAKTFEKFVLGPLSRISHHPNPIVIILDGLDECEEFVQVLGMFEAMIKHKTVSDCIRFILSTRPSIAFRRSIPSNVHLTFDRMEDEQDARRLIGSLEWIERARGPDGRMNFRWLAGQQGGEPQDVPESVAQSYQKSLLRLTDGLLTVREYHKAFTPFVINPNRGTTIEDSIVSALVSTVCLVDEEGLVMPPHESFSLFLNRSLKVNQERIKHQLSRDQADYLLVSVDPEDVDGRIKRYKGNTSPSRPRQSRTLATVEGISPTARAFGVGRWTKLFDQRS